MATTGMSWNERPQKVIKLFFSFIRSLYSVLLLADQKRTEGKKAAGSDDSDEERPKKKSAKANGSGKSKNKR